MFMRRKICYIENLANLEKLLKTDLSLFVPPLKGQRFSGSCGRCSPSNMIIQGGIIQQVA
jgi:hypothetical protein